MRWLQSFPQRGSQHPQLILGYLQICLSWQLVLYGPCTISLQWWHIVTCHCCSGRVTVHLSWRLGVQRQLGDWRLVAAGNVSVLFYIGICLHSGNKIHTDCCSNSTTYELPNVPLGHYAPSFLIYFIFFTVSENVVYDFLFCVQKPQVCFLRVMKAHAVAFIAEKVWTVL